MDIFGNAYNAGKSWPTTIVTSRQRYGCCGSGNFLIIAYKELRKLEMEVIDALNAVSGQVEMYYSGIRLSQFFGIEIDDFAHEVAVLSLWLAEHQMNMAFKAKFGYAEAALLLRDSGNIVCGNALRMDWEEVCPPVDANGTPYEVYICGNPPFVHSKKRSTEQNLEMAAVFCEFEKFGFIDYVAAWFVKASKYIEETDMMVAFVATNSITQGEQVSQLWPTLLKKIEIQFAVSSFQWSNNAKKNAGVHVVIVGIKSRGRHSKETKIIYREIDGYNQFFQASNTSPYLVDATDSVVYSRSKPFGIKQEMVYKLLW